MSSNNQGDEKDPFQLRTDKLKQIDALYREQIKKIYTDSKIKIEKDAEKKAEDKTDLFSKKVGASTINPVSASKVMISHKSSSTLNIPESQSSSKMLNTGSIDDKIRASGFLKGDSTRTIESLRRQNESKQLKIREMSNKCESLVHKLRKHLSEAQFENQMQSLRQFADGKMERLEHLFKIKQEQIFFKIKLQAIGLLQQFDVSKDQLAEFSDISSESSLFILMSRKLKNRLKDFRSKEQESSFELQKDRILNQKQEERIHYLTETNQLLKLSENKLKNKIEDLKHQLNQYLDRLKSRQQENEQNENEVFRLKKQNEELQNVNQKLSGALKAANAEKQEQKRLWQSKEKEMKALLNNYFVEKKKLEGDLQQKDSEMEEMLIKLKFLEQDNERINRELIRWKERYEWLEREKNSKLKEIQDERSALLFKFEEYKLRFNEGLQLQQQGQMSEAFRKIQDYQRAYERVVLELQEERNLIQRQQEENQERRESEERQWLQRFKYLQKLKEEQLFEINQDHDARIRELRDEFQRKEQLLSEEMTARLKALLAQRDKKATERLIEMQTENDQLRRQISDLNKIIEVKESLINVINSKKL